MTGFLNTVSYIVSSAWVVALMIVLGIALFIYLMIRLYFRLRTAHLGNIEYERHFATDGVYEGEEVELIETIRNRGFFPLFFVDVESYLPPEIRVVDYETGDAMPYLLSRFQLMPYM